jgi:GTP pyrophosphokinase
LSELTTQSAIENVLARYSYKDWDTLCASVGQGAVKEGQVINRLYDEYSEKIIKETPLDKMVEKLAELRREKTAAKKAKLTSADVVVKGVGSFPDIRLSKCCAPLPGDEIVGFITRGRGVSIHRTDCKNVMGLSELNRERLIETWWRLPEEENFNATYRAELLISAEASKNLFTTICGVCEKENVPIQSINARMNDEGRYAFDVSVEIKTIGQLNSLIKKLKSVKGVFEVRRSSN